jgi:hypothetical protein
MFCLPPGPAAKRGGRTFKIDIPWDVRPLALCLAASAPPRALRCAVRPYASRQSSQEYARRRRHPERLHGTRANEKASGNGGAAHRGRQSRLGPAVQKGTQGELKRRAPAAGFTRTRTSGALSAHIDQRRVRKSTGSGCLNRSRSRADSSDQTVWNQSKLAVKPTKYSRPKMSYVAASVSNGAPATNGSILSNRFVIPARICSSEVT